MNSQNRARIAARAERAVHVKPALARLELAHHLAQEDRDVGRGAHGAPPAGGAGLSALRRSKASERSSGSFCA